MSTIKPKASGSRACPRYYELKNRNEDKMISMLDRKRKHDYYNEDLRPKRAKKEKKLTKIEKCELAKKQVEEELKLLKEMIENDTFE